MISAIRAANATVLVAGLLSTGTPASKATASLPTMPQAGKLKALMWIASPCRGTSTSWALILEPRMISTGSDAEIQRPSELSPKVLAR